MYICIIKLMKFSMLFIITLSIILGIDSFVTCLSVGICYTSITRRKAFALFASVGLFHFFMCLLGYLPATICPSIGFGKTHYLSAIIFSLISAKMIYEGVMPLIRKSEMVCDVDTFNLSFFKIILISFAISIDAIAAGFSVSILDLGIPFMFIPGSFAVVSFIMSLVGFYSGRLFSVYFKDYANIIGGLTLLVLAVKTVVV